MWAVHDHGAWRHPAQLYLSVAAAACFVALLSIERMRFLPENGLFYLGGALFCVDRLIVEFFREGSTIALGVTPAQAACIAGFAFFVVKLRRLLRAPGLPVSALAQAQTT